MRVRVVAGASVMSVVCSIGVAWSPPAGAVSAPEVVAEGLDEPYKLSFGADGNLYVAEAGRGGAGPCVDPPERPDGDPPPVCFGTSGAVTRVVGGDGAQSRVVEGLPSVSGAEGADAVGPTDVVMAADGALLVTVGLGGNVNTRADFGTGGTRLGTVLRAVPGGATTVYADLALFESVSDPDATQPGAEGVGEGGDSNPFGSELVGDDLYVVDAGGNDLVRVRAGAVELVSLFPFGSTPAPPFLGAPPGTMIPLQPVPTSVDRAPDGTLRVGEVTGFPFPAGAADVYRVVAATGEVGVAASGLTHIMDLDHDAAGNLYVAQLSRRSLLEGEPAPEVVQLRPDGTRKILLDASQLRGAPTGLTVGPDGMLYVSLGLAGAGGGRVVRVDPTAAGDEASAAACPPSRIPGSGFGDLADTVHREAIECLAWWDVVGGVTPDRFAPDQTATRGAVATMLARVLEESGTVLPGAPPDAFTDDADSPHHLRINQLAALGLVRGFGDGSFRPSQVVTRAQLATLLVQAHERLYGDLAPGADAFTDDETSVHEANINAAHAAGWVLGRTATVFEPQGGALRGQTATVLARFLATLAEGGSVVLPSAVG